MYTKDTQLLFPLTWFGESDEAASSAQAAQDEIDALLKDVDKLSPEDMKALLEKQNIRIQLLGKKSKELLHEVMDKKEKMRKIEEEKEAAKLAELKQKEEYKKLYEEADAKNKDLQSKVDLLTADTAKTMEFFAKQLEAAKADLPAEYHNLIPAVSVREQVAWIDNFKRTVVIKQQQQKEKPPADKPPTPPVGTGGTPPVPPKDETGKAKFEELIKNCKNEIELERLQQAYASGRLSE